MTLKSKSIEAATSANAAMTRSLKVVFDLSCATLVFSVVIFTLTLAGLFFKPVTVFTVGTLLFFHGFWVSVPMFITSVLGMCGYEKGVYKHCPATAHLVFAIITAIAVLAGLVILVMNLVGMTFYVVQILEHQETNAHRLPSVLINVAYAGTISATLVYIFFFYACIHGAVMYCRAPRNLVVYNVLTMPAPLIQDNVKPAYHKSKYGYEV
ncbi:hypothetical protein TrispH2_009417 [Trichoplax sp. H2]|nr:hypothetical protein TrispH2_009417 [Trichoplax sp. H2]|eukprot:RDD38084.1 hypothetical protein TrispH2_009417 [Trichoplax sp. H2]